MNSPTSLTIADVSASHAVRDTRHKNDLDIATNKVVSCTPNHIKKAVSKDALAPFRNVIMTGSICCNRCGRPMQENGVCSHCNTASCHVQIYWKRPYKFYKDRNKISYGYSTAIAALLEINIQIKQNKFNPNNWISGKVEERLVRNLVHLWLADKDKEVKEGRLAPGGVAPYHTHVKHYIVPILGDYDIREVDKKAVKQFYAELKKKPLKHKSQKNIMDGLHAFFGWVFDLDEEYIDKIPPFPTVRVTDAQPQQATDSETQRQAVQRIPEEHRAIFELEVELYLRPGEAAVLKVKDYLPELAKIWIRRTESLRVVIETTKGKKKVKQPLTERSLAIVQKHTYNRFGEDWLFIDPENGNRYTQQKLRKIWKKYTGLTIKHYEGTRHTSISQLAKDTHGDGPLLQEAARHSDFKTTRGYIHENNDRVREAMNNRGKVLPATYPQQDKK